MKFGNEPELLYSNIYAGVYNVSNEYTDDSKFFFVAKILGTSIEVGSASSTGHRDESVNVTVTFSSTNHTVTITNTNVNASISESAYSGGTIAGDLWAIK